MPHPRSTGSVRLHYAAFLQQILQYPAVCIGPITAEALKEYDWQNVFISELHTIDGMCDTIITMIKTNLQRG